MEFIVKLPPAASL